MRSRRSAGALVNNGQFDACLGQLAHTIHQRPGLCSKLLELARESLCLRVECRAHSGSYHGADEMAHAFRLTDLTNRCQQIRNELVNLADPGAPIPTEVLDYIEVFPGRAISVLDRKTVCASG